MSVVSGVYDSYGLVSSVVVELKSLVEELWRKTFGRDNELPDTGERVQGNIFSGGTVGSKARQEPRQRFR